MIRPACLSAAALWLAACASPQERCRAEAARDLRIVDGLIAETEATLARGYAIETRTSVAPRLTLCTGAFRNDGGISFCTTEEIIERHRPVAVDLGDERAKLEGLRGKRSELAARTRRALAACEALPE